MKKLIVILVIIIVWGCDNGVSPNTAIIGNWVWVSSSGGIDGRVETPASTGDEIRIEITEDRIVKYVNNVQTADRSYNIDKGSSIYSIEEVELIVYQGGISQSFTVSDNKLILYDECYDCFQYEYIKE